MHDGIHSAAVEMAAVELAVAGQAFESGRAAFDTLCPSYGSRAYDHHREGIWHAAVTWSQREGIGNLHGDNTPAESRLNAQDTAIWREFLNGWCEAAVSADVDPIVWGYVETKDGWER